MKKSIFSKIMACFIVLSCAFVVSACSVFQKEDTNIKSIAIVEESVPEVIVVGEFDDAGIKAVVTYEDDSTSEIDVTTEMIPEEYHTLLETPGIYKITIMFRNATTELVVRMVNSTNIYQVNFYNNKNQLITTQFVYDGEDATLPSETMTNVEGWAFVGWDRSHENISEDTNIYGLYVNVENTLSEAKMKQVLLNAEQYYMTNSHFTSVEEVEDWYGEISTKKRTINYHYDNEKELATSQSVSTSDWGKQLLIFDESGFEYLTLYYEPSVSDSNEYCKKSHQEYFEELNAELGEGEDPMTEEEYYQMLLMAKLYGGKEFYTFEELLNAPFGQTCDVAFSYEISSNRLIYTCTLTYTDVDEFSGSGDIQIITIKYDDEKVLQINDSYTYYRNNGEEIVETNNETYNIDYIEVEFEEDLIPNYGDINGDKIIDVADAVLIQQYVEGITTLTEDQLLLADTNLDGEVTIYDANLIRAYLAKNIPYIPFTKESVIELFENAIENGLKSDITLTMVGKWADDEGAATTTVAQIDRTNKICKSESGPDELAYIWENNNVLYEAFTNGSAVDCYKTTGMTFDRFMDAESVYMFVGYQMIYGGSYGGVNYEFLGIEIVDIGFVITINASRLEGAVSGTIKYTFNSEHILSVESTYDYIGTYTYDYSDVTIEHLDSFEEWESKAIEDND